MGVRIVHPHLIIHVLPFLALRRNILLFMFLQKINPVQCAKSLVNTLYSKYIKTQAHTTYTQKKHRHADTYKYKH